MAAQRSTHVPKFGNFDEENVPYTSYFDSARKEKSGGGSVRMNPNDPEENPGAFKLSGSFKNDSTSSNNKSPAPSHHHRKRSSFKGNSSNSSDDNSYSSRTTSVPKFGDWDMNTGYTVIFDKVKEEKQSASSILPEVPQSVVNEPRQEKQRRNWSSSKMRCCFF